MTYIISDPNMPLTSLACPHDLRIRPQYASDVARLSSGAYYRRFDFRSWLGTLQILPKNIARPGAMARRLTVFVAGISHHPTPARQSGCDQCSGTNEAKGALAPHRSP